MARVSHVLLHGRVLLDGVSFRAGEGITAALAGPNDTDRAHHGNQKQRRPVMARRPGGLPELARSRTSGFLDLGDGCGFVRPSLC
jgi:hypothetical protein